jgi:glutaredoxin-dependent peroxiredoxin
MTATWVAASMPVPTPGTKLPDFTLPLATKEGRKEFKLSEATKDGPVVLAFYPLAFSGVCTTELCDMRDNLAQFSTVGAKVYGFSADSPFANVEFAKANDAGQGLISDPNREVLPKIWDTMTVAGVQNVAKRGVLVVGKDGAVKWASVSDDPKVWVGAKEIQKHL